MSDAISSGPLPATTEPSRSVVGSADPSLRDLVRSSLWLGAVGFGGGLSVLANIRTHTVEQRRWLTDPEFNSIAAVSQMLPGGASANALAQIGLRFQGFRGA